MRHLVLFRSPSRHTAGFDGAHELFCVELQQRTLPGLLRLHRATASHSAWWAEGVAPETLERAAAGAVGVQGLYEVQHAESRIEDLCVPDPVTALELIDLSRPNLTNLERDAMRARLQILVPPPEPRVPAPSPPPATAAVARRTVIVAPDLVALGRRLLCGPAGGAGAPGLAPRRPASGILRTFALRSRPCRTATATEPEPLERSIFPFQAVLGVPGMTWRSSLSWMVPGATLSRSRA